jgi:uncharacterized protein YgbK (DUF1537 family)
MDRGQAGEREWLVAADDRTGALEVAAGLAAHLGPTVVAVRQPVAGSCVVDIGSRSADRVAARARAVAVDALGSRLTAHKIDSTLRGHWAHEVTARCAGSGRRLLVVAAWPAMGRTCVEGVVHVHGAPHGRLDRHVKGLELLTSLTLTAWLDGDGPRAAVDVGDTAALDEVAAIIAAHPAFLAGQVLLAAPAAPIASVLGRASLAGVEERTPDAVRPTQRVEGSIIVVSGSATEISAAQLAAVRSSRPHVEVFAPRPKGGPLDSSVAREVVRRARARVAKGGVGAIVVVGGSTAALLLGDGPRLVHRMALPGLPWSTPLSGSGPLSISKAGGFGNADTLVEAVDVLDSWR